MNQQTSFERYISLAKSNLENYYATNDVKFLLKHLDFIGLITTTTQMTKMQH